MGKKAAVGPGPDGIPWVGLGDGTDLRLGDAAASFELRGRACPRSGMQSSGEPVVPREGGAQRLKAGGELPGPRGPARAGRATLTWQHATLPADACPAPHSS